MTTELTRKEKRKQKKHNHPLGLPQGSIRAILVIILTVFFGVCIVIEREIPTDIGIVWVSLISYYIGHRSNSTTTSNT